MTLEEKAWQDIDQLLEKAGWKIQDYNEFNLGASLGVAVREFSLKADFADYLMPSKNKRWRFQGYSPLMTV